MVLASALVTESRSRCSALRGKPQAALPPRPPPRIPCFFPTLPSIRLCSAYCLEAFTEITAFPLDLGITTPFRKFLKPRDTVVWPLRLKAPSLAMHFSNSPGARRTAPRERRSPLQHFLYSPNASLSSLSHGFTASKGNPKM